VLYCSCSTGNTLYVYSIRIQNPAAPAWQRDSAPKFKSRFAAFYPQNAKGEEKRHPADSQHRIYRSFERQQQLAIWCVMIAAVLLLIFEVLRISSVMEHISPPCRVSACLAFSYGQLT
jgi:hypothetical protein